jgi:alpha-tubulin suppressor-like RCC1 family protein
MNALTNIQQRTQPSRRRTSSLVVTFVVALFAAIGLLVVTVEMTDAKPQDAKAQEEVWAWGSNWWGELGVDTSREPRNTPVQVSGLSDVKAVAGGWGHSLALKNDGTLWAWGYNGSGQLGDGTTTWEPRNTPVQVSGLSDVKAVAAGWDHNLALKNDGTLWAWGFNYYGQLGDGSNPDIYPPHSSTPVRVSGLADVKAIAGGAEHSLALKNDGTVWAWGHNNLGQLGNGTNTDSRTPVQVSGLSDVKTIAAGSGHSLALKNDGTLWAWGDNYLGQLGDGTNTQSNTPVQVSGLTDVKVIAGGHAHSLALKSDGTVWAWGINQSGELGDGTNTQSNTPVQVSGLSGVKAIAAGVDHSLSIGKAKGNQPM